MATGYYNRYDLKQEGEVAEYLKNLEIEFTYQCFQEDLPRKEKAEGCHTLGKFMESARNDFFKARHVYEKNCLENEYGHSCFKLGQLTQLGKGTEDGADIHKALIAYDAGCRYGSGESCHNAAILSNFGMTLEAPPTTKIALNKSSQAKANKDYVKIEEYLKKGCALKNFASCLELSRFYADGRVSPDGKSSIAQDWNKTVKYAQLSCDADIIGGCVILSHCYKNGFGVQKNERTSECIQNKAKGLLEKQKNPAQGKTLMGQ